MPNNIRFDFEAYILAHKTYFPSVPVIEEEIDYNLLDNIIVVGETQ